MQLSFPSVPTDSASAIAPPSAQASGTGTSDADGGATPFGFAQVLAGVAPATVTGQGASLLPGSNPLSPLPSNLALLNSVLPTPTVTGEISVLAGQGGATIDTATLGGRAMTVAIPGTVKPGSAGPSAPSAPRSAEQKGLAEAGDIQALAVTAALLPVPVPPAPLQPSPGEADAGGAKVDAPSGNVFEFGARIQAGAGSGVTALQGLTGPVIAGSGDKAQAANDAVSLTTSGAPAAPALSAADNVATANNVDRIAFTIPKVAGSEIKTPVTSLPVAHAASSVATEGATPVQPDQAQPGTAAMPTETRAITATDIARAAIPEKFASIAAPQTTVAQTPIAGATKSTLPAQRKGVAQQEPVFGIGVAKPDATMPAGSTFARSPISEAPPVTASPSIADTRSSTDSVPQPVMLTSSAHRAVEAVLDATDRFAARDQHSVNLQFSVGGTDLSVRVEMRSGEVHTTFRTDSPELRAALSSEWNSMTSQQNGDRSARLASPVFTGNDQAGTSTSFSGDGASRQRDPQSREPAAQNSGFAASRRDPAPTGSSSNSNSPMTRSVAVNSVHLHTLA